MSFAREAYGGLTASVVFAVLGAAAGIVPYIAAAQILTLVCAGMYELGPIAAAASVALVGYLGSVWLASASTIISHRCAFITLNSIRKALTDKLSRVPMGTVLDQPSGTFKTLIVDTVEKLELPLAHMVPELTANTLIPVLMLAYLFVLDWRLALISLITIPVGICCYMGMMKDYGPRYARVLDASKNMDAAIVEYIGGIEVIKGFNQSTASYGRYVDAVRANEDAKVTWFRQTNPFYVAGVTIMPSCLIGVLPLGSLLYLSGDISASALITCIILALGLVKPLMQALRYTDSLAMVDSTVAEVSTLLDAPEMKRPSTPVEIPDYRITFDKVSFGYGKEEVLHGISLAIEPHAMTALVGPSGSGKSTVARLIASFWEADGGSVGIGGIDVKDIPLEQVMRSISYVTQDNYLFDLTVRENIRMGKPDASDAEVEEAAQRASCHEFICALPAGYDTCVGSAGARLSGGERQRIAIARAVLKNAPIVILDEATAFTDPENEAAIQASISGLVTGKTLIIIAHHLSTIVGADKIVVMDHGRISAEGTHHGLLESSPLYRSLWNAQQEATHAGGDTA
ncbi:multidrug ABC transporter permease [Olsenella sp. oral taxon 807]|uniref:ABC transporter ATP-binding protein n=1 Tax=Olsenella sp. oral taxon 807 TaxID=712411 RepID=UPI000679EDD5|nr:multidrug ABC transporter permease [Olsenella sp. oral taxon 807]